MHVKNRLNADHYLWGEGCDGWRLLDRPELSVIQERIPPGLGEIRHYHHTARQLFFVLKGQLEIAVGETLELLGEGDSLEVPPEQPHQVRNRADEDAHFLVISAPSTQADRTNLE